MSLKLISNPISIPKNNKSIQQKIAQIAKAANDVQRAAIGNQSGGRVFLFLYTDDFWRDYKNMQAKGVSFVHEPETHEYGTVAVFKDL